ncbi:MAG: hypothetical protein RLY20_2309 [Verrucomicrobiota bacterium]|jgi:membrane protein YdbS with pleckstrin-like domain
MRAAMKRVSNIQFTSPENDRSVMLRVSIVAMVLLWIIAAAILTFGWMLASSASDFQWDVKHMATGALLTIVCLLAIPMQIRRYIRELRLQKLSNFESTKERDTAP